MCVIWYFYLIWLDNWGCSTDDFTSSQEKNQGKAHHPLEPVVDKLYSHLHTSAHHIPVPSLLPSPTQDSLSSAWHHSTPNLDK